MVLTCHPLNIVVQNIVLKHFRTLREDPATSAIFTESTTPICSFRRDRSFSNHVVHSALPNTSKTAENGAFGTFPCKRPRCKTCAHVNETSSITGPRSHFRIRGQYSCTTTNFVDSITCTRGKIYIGETKRRLSHRFTEHLRK